MINFIWTECLGCPEIGSVAIRSFLCHHPNLTLHVFAYNEDLVFLPKNDRVVYHIFPTRAPLSNFTDFFRRFLKLHYLDEAYLKRSFQRGHKGTARLWAYVLKHFSYCDNFIHFDADIVFTSDAITRLISLSTEYDFIGQCRPYQHNSNNDTVRSLPDLVQTCCFLFKPSLIPSIHRLSQFSLALAIQGRNRITGLKLLDFFDQLSLEARNNGAQFYFLPVADFGGMAPNGSRHSTYSHLNDFPTKYKIDVGRYFVHFSAVGSGYNIWKNNASSGSPEYDKYALDRFSLFMSCFYPGFPSICSDSTQYNELIDYFRSSTSFTSFFDFDS